MCCTAKNTRDPWRFGTAMAGEGGWPPRESVERVGEDGMDDVPQWRPDPQQILPFIGFHGGPVF